MSDEGTPDSGTVTEIITKKGDDYYRGCSASRVRTFLNVADGANAYSHPTGSGNNHVPAGGSAGQFLTYSSSGTAQWGSVSGYDGTQHMEPNLDNTYDIGSAQKRWRNLYVADLQMSNQNTGGNEVDGTEGSWSIQEGEEDLFIINRSTGKKYKFKLEEIV
jgi:hypothetical protein